MASVSGHAGTTAPGRPLTQRQSDQDMVDFARCMRGHGVPMADPSHRPWELSRRGALNEERWTYSRVHAD